jgi:hypothetical protein
MIQDWIDADNHFFQQLLCSLNPEQIELPLSKTPVMPLTDAPVLPPCLVLGAENKRCNQRAKLVSYRQSGTKRKSDEKSRDEDKDLKDQCQQQVQHHHPVKHCEDAENTWTNDPENSIAAPVVVSWIETNKDSSGEEKNTKKNRC